MDKIVNKLKTDKGFCPEDDQEGLLKLNGSLDSFSSGGYQAFPSVSSQIKTKRSLSNSVNNNLSPDSSVPSIAPIKQNGDFRPQEDQQMGENSESDGKPTTVICPECGIVIRHLTNLAVHMRRHFCYKPFVCSECSYSGYDEDDVRRHIHRSHPAESANLKVQYSPDSGLESSVQALIDKTKTGLLVNGTGGNAMDSKPQTTPVIDSLLKFNCPATSGNVQCLLCNESVQTQPISLLKHLKSHLRFSGYSCPSCLASSPTWMEFATHLEQAHPSKPETIRLCQESRTLLAEKFLKLACCAFRRGLNQPSLPCVQCGEDVKWANVEEHCLKEAGSTPWSCNECTANFATMESVIDHRKTTHPEKFPGFSLMFEMCAEIKTESRWASIEKSFPVLAAESIEMLQTDETMGINLAMNLRRLSSSSLEDGDGKVMVVCGLCSAHISRSMSCLIAHAKVHLAYKPLKCEYCNFRHFAMSKIRRHSNRVHVNKKVKVSYHPVADIGRQIKQMKQRCFGAQASSVAWGDLSPGNRDSDIMNASDLIEHDDMIEDEESDLMEGPMPVTLSSPQPTNEMMDNIDISPLSDNSNVMSTTYIQNPHVSKLLEQLMREPQNSSAVYANQGSVDSFNDPDQLPVSRGSGIFPQMTSPEPRMVTPSSGETYDLNGMGKKVCSVCNTFIANNPSSFDNHACKHLDYKPYYCHYCQYQSYIRGKVTRHIQQVHHGLAVKINHRPVPGIKDKIQQIKLKCFPFLIGGDSASGDYGNSGGTVLGSTGMTPNKNLSASYDEVKCRMCESSVTALEVAMDEHIQIHIATKYYHCPVCTYQTTYLIRAKQHVHSAHPTSQETRILCCPPDGMKGLHSLRVKCFGNSVWAPGSISEAHRSTGFGDSDPNALPVVTADDEDSRQSFPDSSTGGAQGDSGSNPGVNGRISCGVCKALVCNLPAAIGTHVRNHLTDYKPYQCSYCPWKSSSEAEVKVHISATHKNVPLRVVYNPERQELQQMQERCFPSIRIFSMANPDSQLNNGGAGSTLLKKLICQLCKNTIADNPKSVGIHVKNHLNYKPYRCPFCKYMSCEQSKARRHVEHVHSVSGDTVEIHAEEGIKEKISDMKGRCFPSLVSDSNYVADSPEGYMGGSMMDDSSNGLNGSPNNQYTDDSQIMEEWTCRICRDSVGTDSVDSHVKGHLSKPFQCGYCSSRFWTDEKVLAHIETVHPGNPERYLNQPFNAAEPDTQLNEMRAKCFPELLLEDGYPGLNQGSSNQHLQSPSVYPILGNNNNLRMKSPAAEGKLKCRVCDQWVSCNPNSLDVHAKTHLNFKQHQCGYCNYRSCIAGKVKRHLDNVHRGQEVSMLSYTALSAVVKQVVADMRSTCFPQIEGDHAPKSRSEIATVVNNLKAKLLAELQDLPNSAPDLDQMELTAAMAAAAGARIPGNGNPIIPISTDSRNSTPLPPNGTEMDLEDDGMDSSSNRGTETPLDPGFGKIQCQQCGTYVADNPSSLGLHVRNHLDYKPFSCNLCDYKSCIQAKVKRHLRNVHKCPTDEMTYSPEADIRLKVMDMKMKCFPKMLDAVESAMNGGNQGTSDEIGLREIFQSPTMMSQNSSNFRPTSNGVSGQAQPQQLDTVNSLLDTMLGVEGSAASIIAELTSGNARNVQEIIESAKEKQRENSQKIACKLCFQLVFPSAKDDHLKTHSNESQWHCSDCGFGSFVQDLIRDHADEKHPGGTAQPVRFSSGGAQLSEEEMVQLKSECFPVTMAEHSGLNGHDGENVKCDTGAGNVLTEEINGVILGEEELGDDEEEMDIEMTGTSEVTSIKKNGTDGPRYICQMCGQAVSMYASSLYVHVKNHMNYKPYCCAHCDYRSPVKSKVRRHIQNAHRRLPMTINYFPTPGIDHEVLRMKKKCFPDVTSFATLTNDKVPCLKCKTDVADTPLSKSVHAKNHLDSKPYHCGYCVYRSCLKGETRRHVSRQHPRKPMRIIFRSEEVVDRDQVDSMIAQCFLNSGSGTNSSEMMGGDLEGDVDSEEEPQVGKEPLSAEQARSAVASVWPVEGSETAVKIKLGPAYREWYCPYCSFSDTSKYHVKEHCLSDHPGQKVHVAANLEQVSYVS